MKLTKNPYLLMALLLTLWGSFAVASKFALQSLDNFQLQFYMFGSAIIVLTPLFIISGRMKRLLALPRKEAGKLVLYGVPSYLYYLFYILALNLIPAIEASMLNYMFPILIVVLSVPMNGEKLTGAIVLAALLGCAGMIFIVTGGSLAELQLSNVAGDLFALGGAFCWALFSNLGKRNHVDADLSNYVYTLTGFVLSTVTLLIFSKFTLPDWTSSAWVIWLGVSNIVLAYYLWFRGLQSSSASLIASLSFLAPFFTLMFIVIFLDEQLAAGQFFGLLLIMTGIVIQVASEKRGKRSVSM
ncbi:DMT family transporter [Paenibacillus eucommiae]|uniref:Drug/metabolite transporter (DMT)-like permease n=1 Tax=Paenibacillus eucommiae TaxID=1355755 RepID=A0ABS4J1P4_9BACL|nr:EamA family transporter [Paenibacillus eucommiae]MBP1993181.1 drug/metabolite transporter (DMT)-like permease [Paenibacillus eucommiae]